MPDILSGHPLRDAAEIRLLWLSDNPTSLSAADLQTPEPKPAENGCFLKETGNTSSQKLSLHWLPILCVLTAPHAGSGFALMLLWYDGLLAFF